MRGLVLAPASRPARSATRSRHFAANIGSANDKLRTRQVKRFASYKSHLVEELQKRLHHPELADRFGAPFKDVKIPQKRLTARGQLKAVQRVVFGLALLPSEIIINAS